MERTCGYGGLTLLLAASLACGPGSLRVATIQLGRSLNADNSVGISTTSFKPQDTIYVALLTEGAGRGTVAVRWLYAGQVIGQGSRAVAYKGNGVTEFHLQNARGFPAGEYAVEVSVDGQVVGVRNFRIAP